ncbi:MAG TPA: VOC family protein, partial [bacterium]|nr:VOC family protein [bacterium]
TTASLWPARLHHLQISTPRLAEMAAFYQRGFSYRIQELRSDLLYLAGGQRRLLLGSGAAQQLAMAAFALRDAAQLKALRKHVRAQGIALQDVPTPLLQQGAFAVADPDGRLLAFGLPAPEEARTDVLPGRLQHVVVTTRDVPRVAAFYQEALGFHVSDRVLTAEGALTTVFLRSDPEHHSFAVFRADVARLDHHSLEVPSWNTIRDWGDHFAALEHPIHWGPGRHGPGNNLFFMVKDPDQNWVEISAELQQMPVGATGRDWPHTERTLNLWGQGMLRS